MNYSLKTPCDNCPFRSDVRPYIHPERVKEIVGQPFSCHKTTTAKGRSNLHPKAQHCAGALILLEKMEEPHQLMRIAERLKLYDRTKLDMGAPVYNSAKEMLEAHKRER